MKDQVVAFLQRHPGVFVIVAVVALAGVSLAVGIGGPGAGSSPGEADEIETTTSTTAADGSAEEQGVGRTPSSDDVEVLDGTGDSDPADGVDGQSEAAGWDEADVPPDVAHGRDPIDLDTDPPPDDVREVGRWWSATYTAHVGAEPGSDLADRLDSYTTDTLITDIAAVPPAATYTEPLLIEGVSVGEPMVEEDQVVDGQRILRVTVETVNALAIYDVTLIDEDGRWLVDRIAEL